MVMSGNCRIRCNTKVLARHFFLRDPRSLRCRPPTAQWHGVILAPRVPCFACGDVYLPGGFALPLLTARVGFDCGRASQPCCSVCQAEGPFSLSLSLSLRADVSSRSARRALSLCPLSMRPHGLCWGRRALPPPFRLLSPPTTTTASTRGFPTDRAAGREPSSRLYYYYYY